MGFKKWLMSEMKVISHKENIHQLCDATGNFVFPVGPATVPTNSLHGTLVSSKDDFDRVKELATRIGSPNGYIERIIVDDQGNVVEGQHRFAALKMLGYKKIPVYKIINFENYYDVRKIASIIENIMPLHRDRLNMFIRSIFENILNEKGNVEEAKLYDWSGNWQKAYDAVLNTLHSIKI